MIFNLQFYIPLLVSMSVPIIVIMLLGKDHFLTRIIMSSLCIALAIRYIWWRYYFSIPTEQEVWQNIWAWIFFCVETSTILSSVLVYIFMSRRLDRTKYANRPIPPEMANAPIDVFIATYNESKQILERTLVGATGIDHPNLRVWVLDDGNRKWVHDLAEEFGAFYCPRNKGKHAKAGNVNNGLYHALKTDRPPEFILLLDADFVASKKILKRTLPLFLEQDVGIVQTPQHFFNPDPVQSNLLCTDSWPDEQRFFFNELLPCKDAWGCAFCCGTSAVFRVAALVKANGMAHETVTEDMLTTFRLLEQDYRTVFLNECLSLGLAPEGLAEYIGQRSRWCLGAIQQIYTRWSFMGSAKLNFINRVSCFDGVLFWSSGFLFKIMMMSAPLIYWWTGTAVINSTVEDMLNWLAPYLICTMIFMYFMASNRVLPIMTDVSHLICSPTIVVTVLIGLVKPYGHKFKVTAKGTSSDKVIIQWKLLMPFALIAVGTVLGMIYNMNAQSTIYGTPGFTVNVFWSVFNVFVLTTACMVCVEMPRRRKDERFPTNENAHIRIGTNLFDAHIVDISVGGARLEYKENWNLTPGQKGELIFSDGYSIDFDALRVFNNLLPIKFINDTKTKRIMIGRIFTGLYSNEVMKVSVWACLVSVLKKIFT